MSKWKTPLTILGIIGGTSIVLGLLGFTGKQITATAVFLTIICGTLCYWKFRLGFALMGLATLLSGKLIDIPHMIEFAGLDIILFLFGMMAVIGYLEEKHFFEFFVAKVVDAVGERPYILMTILMILSTFFAALVDEVTSILFMMATMFHITKRYKVKPAPFLLMIVFATNIGSSATAVGNPIGVMIALRAGLAFADFLRWSAPIAAVSLALTIAICLVIFRGALEDLKGKMKKDKDHSLHELQHVRYKKSDITICWALFLSTIGCLVLHHNIEHYFHLEKNTLLIGTALFFGAVAIFLKANDARDFFNRRVDWWTLSFFMILFASVGTLRYVGVTQRVAEGMIHLAGDNSYGLITIFTASISLLTAFMDNVLAVATFIPIVSEIDKAGIYVFPFWWAMLFGGTLYGNATVIGSTANIVAMGMLEKEGHEPIKFMEWAKPGVIISTVTILMAMFLLFAQYSVMPNAPAKF